jgi:CDGSH-type Zn-finger protein
MDTFGYIKTHLYSCDKCQYKTNNKTEYNRHLSTQKHEMDTLDTSENAFVCKCGKSYKYSQGLSKHKKVCNNEGSNKIITELVKQNKELNDIILEQNKQLLRQSSMLIIQQTGAKIEK